MLEPEELNPNPKTWQDVHELTVNHAPVPDETYEMYTLKSGIQYWEGNYITATALARVANLLECEGKDVAGGFSAFSYHAKARIEGDKILVNANRVGCKIDKVAVASLVSEEVEKEKLRMIERAKQDQLRRAVDPRGPYKLGCEAYQQHIKGLSDVTSIDTATKLYPKLKPTYVKNLFITGWNDASVYGARGVDCEYLSIGVRG